MGAISKSVIQRVFRKKVFWGGAVHLTRWVSGARARNRTIHLLYILIVHVLFGGNDLVAPDEQRGSHLASPLASPLVQNLLIPTFYPSRLAFCRLTTDRGCGFPFRWVPKLP